MRDEHDPGSDNGSRALTPVDKNLMDPSAADWEASATMEETASVEAAQVDIRTQEGRKESTLEWGRGLANNGEAFLLPVCDPDLMYEMFLLSAFLRPLIDTMAANVYGADYMLKPILNLDEERDVEKFKRALANKLGMPRDKVEGTTEYKAALDKYRREQDLELERLVAFFEHCSPDGSFYQMRVNLGQDLEVTGNAYLEILRDSVGRLSQLVWTPSRYMRAGPQSYDLVCVQQLVRRTPLDWESRPIQRRFRKYIQNFIGVGINPGRTDAVFLDSAVTFKEMGDPRVLSRASGRYYTKMEDFQKETGGRRRAKWRKGEVRGDVAIPATEILHFGIPFCGSSVYGAPRWAGAYPSAKGSRELDEENMRIAADDVVPSLLLAVSGGRVDGKDQERIATQIADRKPGHKRILILQARSDRAAGPSASPTIKVERLKSEQTQDALFQNYDERNEKKLDACFRIPRAILGKDVPRDRTAVAAMWRFAQDQVFGPARREFDDTITQHILPALGAHYYAYSTSAPQPTDPEALATMISSLLLSGVLTTNEARERVERALGVNLKQLEGTYASIPPKTLLALLQTKNQQAAAAMLDPDADLGDLAEALAAKPEPPVVPMTGMPFGGGNGKGQVPPQSSEGDDTDVRREEPDGAPPDPTATGVPEE